MIIMYLIACIPLFIGAGMFICSKKINWIEWLAGSLSGFIVAGLVHGIVIVGLTHDTETWSGKVTGAKYMPRWIEEYQVAVYKTVTDSKGNSRQVFSHYETRHRTHGPDWTVYCNIGKEWDTSINQSQYEDLKKKFGEEYSISGSRPGYDSGDRNDYLIKNVNNYIQPMSTTYSFQNKIKASKSIYSFITVPEGTPVFEYPTNDLFISNRLLGESKKRIDILFFDRLNSSLGPIKLVNLIVVGFPKDKDSMISKYQESKWIGGKKNDLVICYGESDSGKANWSYCFGWTDKSLVKRNLESIFLENTIDNNILEKIKQEVIKNYVIKDWSQFDYITIDPPMWGYVILIILMIISQGLIWFFFSTNEMDKNS